MTPTRTFRLQALGVALFTAACVAVLVVLFRLAGGDSPLRDPYRVDAVVPSAVALAENADVRRNGVRIGKVAAIAPRAGATVLQLELDTGTPVFRDATVRVRTKTLVGENYVELQPGTRRAGAVSDGGVLPRDRALEPVQFDEILSVLDAPRRRALRSLLRSAGGGLRNRGDQLNRVMEGMAAVATEGTPVAEALGAERREVASLVDDAATVMNALSARGDALRRLARGAKATAEATASEAAAFRSVLRELPPVLVRTRGTVGRVARLGRSGTPVLDDLGRALALLTPAIARLPHAAARTQAAVAELPRLSRDGRGLLRALRGVTPPAVRAVGGLDGLLREAGPLIHHLSPYGPDAAAFFSNMGSATGSYDATGALARVYLIASRSTYASFTPEMRKAFDALSNAGAAGRMLHQGTNAYPRPGSIARPGALLTPYPRVQRDGG